MKTRRKSARVSHTLTWSALSIHFTWFQQIHSASLIESRCIVLKLKGENHALLGLRKAEYSSDALPEVNQE